MQLRSRCRLNNIPPLKPFPPSPGFNRGSAGGSPAPHFSLDFFESELVTVAEECGQLISFRAIYTTELARMISNDGSSLLWTGPVILVLGNAVENLALSR